jgi:ABC-type phosphate transport system substrate-binding protein
MSVRRALRALAGALIVVIPLVQSGPAFAASPINGGGSGFAALEIDQWRADTARAPYSLKVDYVAQGSSFGRGQFASGNLDFGASDIKYPPYEEGTLGPRCGSKALADCFAYVPVSAGGLAFMYNLLDGSGNRVDSLKLSRNTACRIFTGAITKWNDPAIVADNPSLAGISRDIVPVIRADGAGESYVFSEFCIAVAPEVWQAFVDERKQHDQANLGDDFKAGLPVSNWPAGWGRSNSVAFADGTANTVADPTTGRDSITYVAAGYAKVRSFPVASLQNAAGKYTQPDEDNVTVALGYAKGNGDGTFTLDFTGADERAYFPSTYSYILAQTTGFDEGKGSTLGQFLCYAVSKGQEIATQLRYARLSKPLVDLAISQIAKIPGAPGSDSCFIAGAAPPPPPPSVAPGSADPGAGGGGGPADSGAGAAGGVDAAGSASTTAGGTTSPGATTTTAPCKPATTSTTTTSPSASTTSSTTASSTTTTTTAPGATTSSTTTTAPCTTGGASSALYSGDSSQGGSGAGGLATAEDAAASGSGSSTNSLWALLAGAGLCAVLTTVMDWRREANQ